jgi:hypothetical protein
MVLPCAIILVVAGCGRIEFDRCSNDAPFGPATVIDLGSAMNWDFPFVSPDGLELYVTQQIYNKVFVASRASSTSAFGPPVELTTINTGPQNFAASVPADDLTIYLTSTASTEGIYRATRSTRAEVFGTPTEVTEIDAMAMSPDRQGDPRITPDGKTLYYRTNYSATGEQGLFVSQLGSNGIFGAQSQPDVAHVAGSEDDTPFLTADGTALYFASTRPLAGTSAALHIWVAQRDPTTGGWSRPQPILSLPLDVETESPSLSADNCTMYFTERTPSNNTSLGIFQASR